MKAPPRCFPLALLVLSLPFSCCKHAEQQEATRSGQTEPRQSEPKNRGATASHADSEMDTGRKTDNSSPGSRPASRHPLNLRIQYGYEGEFGSLGIADTAAAYQGTRLVAKARALKIIKKQPGPNHILIEENHYSETGEVIYRGTLEFRFGFGGGTLIEQRPISGEKQFNVFSGWPAGN
jgi:hypothetical protein